MGNDRNAGRKRKFDTQTLNDILKHYQEGRSVSELAREFGVSRQTMSFYINEVAYEMDVHSDENTMVWVRGYAYWKKLNREFDIADSEIKKCNVRIEYLLKNELLTSMLVDFQHEKIFVYNHTSHPLKCAFGVKRNPNWEDFMRFMEDRCVPRTRDHMKLILKDYDLDFYDSISIVERTGGRMSEDERSVRMYRLNTRKDGEALYEKL